MNATATLFNDTSLNENSSELVSLAFELARDRKLTTGVGKQGEFQVKTTLSVVDHGMAYDSWVIAKGQVADLMDELRSVRFVKEDGHSKKQISRVALEAARLHISRCELIESHLHKLNQRNPFEPPAEISYSDPEPSMHVVLQDEKSTRGLYSYGLACLLVALAGFVYFTVNRTPEPVILDIVNSGDTSADWQSRVVLPSQTAVEPVNEIASQSNNGAETNEVITIGVKTEISESTIKTPASENKTVIAAFKQLPPEPNTDGKPNSNTLIERNTANDAKTNLKQAVALNTTASIEKSEALGSVVASISHKPAPALTSQKPQSEVTVSASSEIKTQVNPVTPASVMPASVLTDKEALDLMASLTGEKPEKTPGKLAATRDSIFESNFQPNSSTTKRITLKNPIKTRLADSTQQPATVDVESELATFLTEQ